VLRPIPLRSQGKSLLRLCSFSRFQRVTQCDDSIAEWLAFDQPEFEVRAFFEHLGSGTDRQRIEQKTELIQQAALHQQIGEIAAAEDQDVLTVRRKIPPRSGQHPYPESSPAFPARAW
jgi:hypothetical protein